MASGRSFLFYALCMLFFVSAISAKVWQFSAIIDPSQEVPPVVITPNENSTVNLDPHGKARLYFDDETKILNWTIQNNVEEPTSAHIHGPGAVGVNAEPIITLDISTNPIVGKTNLTETFAGYLTNGTMYINIHTADHPAGIIRGQIVFDGYEASLSGKNVVPETNSTAHGTAVLSLDEKSGVLTYEIEHNSTDATSGGIHGPSSESDSVDAFFTFNSTASPITGKATLSSDHVTALKEGKLYIQINSAKFPNGEMRGTIKEAGKDDSDGLSTGIIVLIVFICIGALVAAIAAVYIIRNKRKKPKFEVVAPSGGDYVPPNF